MNFMNFMDQTRVLLGDLLGTKKVFILIFILILSVAVISAFRYTSYIERKVVEDRSLEIASAQFSEALKKKAPLGLKAKNLVIGGNFTQDHIQEINNGSYVMKYSLMDPTKMAGVLKLRHVSSSNVFFLAEGSGSLEDFRSDYEAYLNSAVGSDAKNVKFEVKDTSVPGIKIYEERNVFELKEYTLHVNGSPVYQLDYVNHITVYRESEGSEIFYVKMPPFFPQPNVELIKKDFVSGVYNMQPFIPLDPSLSSYIYRELPKFSVRDFKIIDTSASRAFFFDNSLGYMLPVLTKEVIYLRSEDVKNPNYLFVYFD